VIGCFRGFTGVILRKNAQMRLTMEVEWIADRATLRSLAREHPEWTQQDLVDALGRSLSWIKKWREQTARRSPR
jgi:hypothetical protein